MRAKRFRFALAVLAVLVGCNSDATELASLSYKASRDYASLETITESLARGMKRAEVEELLGEPDYAPIDGQYYYASDRRADSAGGGQVTVPLGLVLDYRDGSGTVTEELQSFRLGPIGE